MGGDEFLRGDKAVQDWCHIFAFCFALASVDALVGLGFGRHLGVSAVCFVAACLFYLAGVKWPRIRAGLPFRKSVKQKTGEVFYQTTIKSPLAPAELRSAALALAGELIGLLEERGYTLEPPDDGLSKRVWDSLPQPDQKLRDQFHVRFEIRFSDVVADVGYYGLLNELIDNRTVRSLLQRKLEDVDDLRAVITGLRGCGKILNDRHAVEAASGAYSTPLGLADLVIEYSHDDRDRSVPPRDRPLLLKNVTAGKNALNVRMKPLEVHDDKLVFRPDIITCIVGGGDVEVVPEWENLKGKARFKLNELPDFLNVFCSRDGRVDKASLDGLFEEKSLWLEIHYESDGKRLVSECELLFTRWHQQIRTGEHRIRFAGQQRAASAVTTAKEIDGAPRLLCKGVSSIKGAITVYEDDMTSSPLVSTARVVGRPFFYHLKIANEPAGTVDRKVAGKVAGRVQMFHENGTPAARERLHRWENSPGPREVGKSADQLVAIDIPPNGIECNLDIAMKYENEDSFYTPNNETAMRIGDAPGWREEDFKFPPGIYIAKVHLSGTNVVTDLRCQIVNKGVGSKLEITPLEHWKGY